MIYRQFSITHYFLTMYDYESNFKQKILLFILQKENEIDILIQSINEKNHRDVQIIQRKTEETKELILSNIVWIDACWGRDGF